MKEFDDMSIAFDYCREKGFPVTVIVDGAKWKLYPSGRADLKAARKEGKLCLCPECGRVLRFDPGERETRNDPGLPAVFYCGECGWEDLIEKVDPDFDWRLVS